MTEWGKKKKLIKRGLSDLQELRHKLWKVARLTLSRKRGHYVRNRKMRHFGAVLMFLHHKYQSVCLSSSFDCAQLLNHKL